MMHDVKTGALKPFNFGRLTTVLPELKKLNCKIDLHTLQPPIDSSNVKTETWIKLATEIENNYDNYNGFIILHGTDTMAYTASALSFMLAHLNKPVILTGSQLPVGAIRTDARRNLITSIEIVSGDVLIPEVCIFFNSQLFRGNRAEKYTSSKFDAFQSPNFPLLAETGVEIKFNREFIREAPDEKLLVHKNFDTSVNFIRLFPGITKSTVDCALSSPGIKAVILETYGSGNAPTDNWFINSLKKAIDKGIIILNVSQCSGGVVDMGKYETSRHLKKIGVISAGDMTTEASITKLMFLLGQDFSKKETEKLLQTSLRGELSGA
jgi:L-asparaginase